MVQVHVKACSYLAGSVLKLYCVLILIQDTGTLEYCSLLGIVHLLVLYIVPFLEETIRENATQWRRKAYKNPGSEKYYLHLSYERFYVIIQFQRTILPSKEGPDDTPSNGGKFPPVGLIPNWYIFLPSH